MLKLDELTKRGNDALLRATIFYLPLTGDDTPPEALSNYLERCNLDALFEALIEQGFPQNIAKRLKELYAAFCEDDDGDEYGMREWEKDLYHLLREAGGWFILAEITGTKRVSESAVQVLGFLTKQQVFWGDTLEDALERAVAWAEANYGKDD